MIGLAEQGGYMQIILMVWNGINGYGAGTILLKGLFIFALMAIFWMVCELVKYTVNVLARLAVDGFRYLAIMIRGWPKEGEDAEDTGDPLHRNRTERGIR
jgi:hypothetical protein